MSTLKPEQNKQNKRLFYDPISCRYFLAEPDELKRMIEKLIDELKEGIEEK